MACRIGISTNPQARIDYWKRQEGLRKASLKQSDLTCQRLLSNHTIPSSIPSPRTIRCVINHRESGLFSGAFRVNEVNLVHITLPGDRVIQELL